MQFKDPYYPAPKPVLVTHMASSVLPFYYKNDETLKVARLRDTTAKDFMSDVVIPYALKVNKFNIDFPQFAAPCLNIKDHPLLGGLIEPFSCFEPQLQNDSNVGLLFNDPVHMNTRAYVPFITLDSHTHQFGFLKANEEDRKLYLWAVNNILIPLMNGDLKQLFLQWRGFAEMDEEEFDTLIEDLYQTSYYTKLAISSELDNAYESYYVDSQTEYLPLFPNENIYYPRYRNAKADEPTWLNNLEEMKESEFFLNGPAVPYVAQSIIPLARNFKPFHESVIPVDADLMFRAFVKDNTTFYEDLIFVDKCFDENRGSKTGLMNYYDMITCLFAVRVARNFFYGSNSAELLTDLLFGVGLLDKRLETTAKVYDSITSEEFDEFRAKVDALFKIALERCIAKDGPLQGMILNRTANPESEGCYDIDKDIQNTLTVKATLLASAKDKEFYTPSLIAQYGANSLFSATVAVGYAAVKREMFGLITEEPHRIMDVDSNVLKDSGHTNPLPIDAYLSAADCKMYAIPSYREIISPKLPKNIPFDDLFDEQDDGLPTNLHELMKAHLAYSPYQYAMIKQVYNLDNSYFLTGSDLITTLGHLQLPTVTYTPETIEKYKLRNVSIDM